MKKGSKSDHQESYRDGWDQGKQAVASTYGKLVEKYKMKSGEALTGLEWGFSEGAMRTLLDAFQTNNERLLELLMQWLFDKEMLEELVKKGYFEESLRRFKEYKEMHKA